MKKIKGHARIRMCFTSTLATNSTSKMILSNRMLGLGGGIYCSSALVEHVFGFDFLYFRKL